MSEAEELIESLQSQLAAKDKEITELRESWDNLLEDMELHGLHEFEPYINSKATFKALANK